MGKKSDRLYLISALFMTIGLATTIAGDIVRRREEKADHVWRESTEIPDAEKVAANGSGIGERV